MEQELERSAVLTSIRGATRELRDLCDPAYLADYREHGLEVPTTQHIEDHLDSLVLAARRIGIDDTTINLAAA